MALLSELVKIVAEVEGLDEVSVGIFARQAREAGHIKQGGRGRSAAKMDTEDAANLLIAVNACALAKDVATGVSTYRSLLVMRQSYTNEENHLLSEVGLFQPGATLGDDLGRVIAMYRDPDQRKIFSEFGAGAVAAEFVRPVHTARITVHLHDKRGRGLAFAHSYWPPKPSSAGTGDRQDQTTISSRTLIAVAEALRN
jgi:hypothetical protein